MTIKGDTTLGQLQIELMKLGIDLVTWGVRESNHIVMLSGPSLNDRDVDITGCGKTMIEAFDDAIVSLTEQIKSELHKET